MDQEAKDLLNKVVDVVTELKDLISESSKQAKPKEDYVDTETICQTFKMSKKSVGRYRKLGLFKSYRIGRKIYFLPSEVKDSLKTHLYGSFKRK